NNKKPLQAGLLKEVYVSAGKFAGLKGDPDTGKALKPKALSGPEFEYRPGEDLRARLFDWLHQPGKPYFGPSFVNRIWGHYLGVGIVHPLDDFSIANPPSNDKLLAALAKAFIDHKFDIKHVERLVLNSRTYQLSSRINKTNKFDKNCF